VKKQKRRSSLGKRLKAYSMAAAGVLAVAPAAQAAIHYSGIKNLVVNSTTTPVSVDLNSDGVSDFVFTYKHTTLAPSWLGIHDNTSAGIGGTAFIGSTTGNYDVHNLPANYLIRNTISLPLSWWVNDAEPLAGTYSTAGDFNYSGAQGYIGVRFQTATGQKFGWIHWRTDTRATQGRIIDWAYEDSGGPIRAGDTGQAVTPVPTLNQWGLIILIGLLAGLSVKKLGKKEDQA
jgi:hypothetical protein